MILTVYRRYYVEIKCQLDATDDIYCMLKMFRAILCTSSGAREYYTDGRCLWYLVLWFSGCRYGVELRVMCVCVCVCVRARVRERERERVCEKYLESMFQGKIQHAFDLIRFFLAT